MDLPPDEKHGRGQHARTESQHTNSRPLRILRELGDMRWVHDYHSAEGVEDDRGNERDDRPAQEDRGERH